MFEEEGDEVFGVETIADLFSCATEADVFEGATGFPTMNPVGENTLVGLAELTGSRKHTSAVDPNRKTEGLPVFEGKKLGAKLHITIKADRRGGREGLGDPGGGKS